MTVALSLSTNKNITENVAFRRSDANLSNCKSGLYCPQIRNKTGLQYLNLSSNVLASLNSFSSEMRTKWKIDTFETPITWHSHAITQTEGCLALPQKLLLAACPFRHLHSCADALCSSLAGK